MSASAGAKYWRVVKAIAWVTFLEIIRDKVLYNTLVAAALLFGFSALASNLAVMRPERVVLDLGLSALTISCAVIATLTGAALIGKEIERRTFSVAMARPISRIQFLIGKYAGLALVLAVNWLLFATAYFSLLAGQAPDFLSVLSVALFYALILALWQSLVLAGLAFFFSSFTTASLSVVFTAGLYLIGSNSSELRMIATRVESPVGKGVLNWTATLLPNFEHFHLGNQATYGLPVSFGFFAGSFFYGLLLTGACLVLTGILIQRREI